MWPLQLRVFALYVDTEENLKLQAIEFILSRDVGIHPQVNTIYNKKLPKLRKF